MAKKKAAAAPKTKSTRPPTTKEEAAHLFRKRTHAEEVEAAIEYVKAKREALAIYTDEWRNDEIAIRLLEIVAANLESLQEYLESDFQSRPFWLTNIIEMAHTAGECEGGVRDAREWALIDKGRKGERALQNRNITREQEKPSRDARKKEVADKAYELAKAGHPTRGKEVWLTKAGEIVASMMWDESQGDDTKNLIGPRSADTIRRWQRLPVHSR